MQFSTKVWEELRKNDDFWLTADIILSNSTVNHTKFLTLVLMEDGIKNRWNMLPTQHKQALKDFMINFLLTTSI